MVEERRRQRAKEIFVAVLFTDEITNQEIEFIDELKRIHRVFIVTAVSDEIWDKDLSTATGYKADRINLNSLKEIPTDLRSESVADIIHILTMSGRPARHIYLHPGPNVQKWNLNLSEIKNVLEQDKQTEVIIK